MSSPGGMQFGQIRHARFKAALCEISAQIAAADAKTGTVIPVLGPTRCGKNELISNLRRAHGGQAKPDGLFARRDSFVLGRIPPRPNERDIHATILAALGLRVPPGEKSALVRERALETVRSSGIRILALDECSHCAERGANFSARAAADHLKTLVDETGITLLLVGLPKFQEILSGNEQLRDRAGATVWMLPYDWQVAGDRSDFTATFLAALRHMECCGLQIDLDTDDVTRRVYGATAGRVGMLVRLLQHAASAAAGSPIGVSAFAEAADRIQAQPVPMAQFFAAEPPEDTQLIRAHAQVLSEAGLEAVPTTTAGLSAAERSRAAA